MRPALFFPDAPCGSARENQRGAENKAEMTASTNLIQRSFELAAGRCEDLTPLVYRRLFREHPEAEPMFRREANDLVKGSYATFSGPTGRLKLMMHGGSCSARSITSSCKAKCRPKADSIPFEEIRSDVDLLLRELAPPR